MRLLYITPRIPYPPLKGDQIVIYHRLRMLGKRHKITLISLYEKDEELNNIDELKKYCEEIHVVKLPKWKSYVNLITKGLISKYPLQAIYFYSKDAKREIKSILNSKDIDLIHAFLLRVTPLLEGIQKPVILDLIDSMQLNLERRIKMDSPPKTWLLKEELRRVSYFERIACNEFAEKLVVSEKDKLYLDGSQITVIPLGVDTSIFKPDSNAIKNINIIFTGNMGYGPNIHAVKWFVEQCFPSIQILIPKVNFVIAGVNPSKEVKDLEKYQGVTVTGYVESIPQILNQAHISIAPMLSGSGMQNKILEAMSCSLPVITTTLGLGSIKAKPGENIFVADTKDKFISTVVTLLKSIELSNNVGSNAREFVIKNYSWEQAGLQVDKIYHRVLEKNRKIEN